MTAAEKLHQLIQTLPERQVDEVLQFAEFIQQRHAAPPGPIPPGTITGLLGIAARTETVQKMGGTPATDQPPPTDQELREAYTDHLIRKYQ